MGQEQRAFDFKHLTRVTLAEYRAALQRSTATSTVNTHLCALRVWRTWLTEHHHLTDNPAARLKLVARVSPDAPLFLTNPAVNALLGAAQQSRHPQRDYAIVQTLLQTGMRLGECQDGGGDMRHFLILS